MSQNKQSDRAQGHFSTVGGSNQRAASSSDENIEHPFDSWRYIYQNDIIRHQNTDFKHLKLGNYLKNALLITHGFDVTERGLCLFSDFR